MAGPVLLQAAQRPGQAPSGDRSRARVDRGQQDAHSPAGRGESPEAVNPAGRIVFINDTLKSNRCNKNTVAFSSNMPHRPLVQQLLSIRLRLLSLSPAPYNWHLSGREQIKNRLVF